MVHLVFHGTKESDTIQNELKLYCNIHNELYISIQEENCSAHIVLNKAIAIKLSKELRKQIALIQDEEGI